MSLVCQIKMINAGGAYPKSCPTCGLGKCVYNLSHPFDENKPMYAVIYQDSIHHQGDQRSRDCLGHGYPAYTEYVEKIRKFSSKDELISWLDSYEAKSTNKIEVIEYKKLSIKTTVELE